VEPISIFKAAAAGGAISLHLLPSTAGEKSLNTEEGCYTDASLRTAPPQST